MAAHDRIRLTGRLREGPREGPFLLGASGGGRRGGGPAAMGEGARRASLLISSSRSVAFPGTVATNGFGLALTRRKDHHQGPDVIRNTQEADSR